MTAPALTAVWLLAQAVTATVEVDRGTVGVGEELTATVTVRTRGGAAPSVSDPPLTGLLSIGRQEVSEVTFEEGSAAPLRITVVTFELRAVRAGTAVFGGVVVRHGNASVETAAREVEVLRSPAGAEAALTPIAQRLLAGAPAPGRADGVALTVVASHERVIVGQQLDVVIAAWFPRRLRARLRRPPAIVTVAPEGAWQYPQEVPPGVVASRRVGGEWMDLFATHLVLFPLRAGRLVIPSQRLEYSVPVTSSFFSREERYAITSDEEGLMVVAPPATPAGANEGVAGRDLAVSLQIRQGRARVGEPLEVAVTVRGEGNVALWPPPVVRWPAGFRAYPGETSVALEASGGRIGGRKTFVSHVVPDTAGTFVVPQVTYPYFDLGRGAYRAAVTPPRELAVAPSGLGASRAAPSLAEGRAPGFAARLTRRWQAWHAAALLAAGPFLFFLLRWRPRGRRRRAPAEHGVRALERDFARVLQARVGAAAHGENAALVTALRAAGLESSLAVHVGRLRERLRAARFAPPPAGDPAELDAELREVIRALAGERRESARSRVIGSAATLALCVLVAPAAGQSAEALYQMGALRPAADSFGARAARSPLVAAHWYNLGATVYRAGDDGRAVAAWTAARRLAPRDRMVRRTYTFLAPVDGPSRWLLWAGPVTPREAWTLAGGCWLLAWLAMGLRVRRPIVWLILLVAIGAGSYGAYAVRRHDTPVAIALTGMALREAPFGSAPARDTLAAGSAMRVHERRGSWALASRPGGARGWVLTAQLVTVPRIP